MPAKMRKRYDALFLFFLRRGRIRQFLCRRERPDGYLVFRWCVSGLRTGKTALPVYRKKFFLLLPLRIRLCGLSSTF